MQAHPSPMALVQASIGPTRAGQGLMSTRRYGAQWRQQAGRHRLSIQRHRRLMRAGSALRLVPGEQVPFQQVNSIRGGRGCVGTVRGAGERQDLIPFAPLRAFAFAPLRAFVLVAGCASKSAAWWRYWAGRRHSPSSRNLPPQGRGGSAAAAAASAATVCSPALTCRCALLQGAKSKT